MVSCCSGVGGVATTTARPSANGTGRRVFSRRCAAVAARVCVWCFPRPACACALWRARRRCVYPPVVARFAVPSEPAPPPRRPPPEAAMSGINRGVKALQRTLNADTRKRAWHYINAEDLIVGRLASSIVPLLTGKWRPDYSPSVDTGDYVVVVNTSKLKFSKDKMKTKTYYWHTGFPGGLKTTSPEELKQKGKDSEILARAVRGMIPKNKLRKHRMLRLRLFPDEEHPHADMFDVPDPASVITKQHYD